MTPLSSRLLQCLSCLLLGLLCLACEASAQAGPDDIPARPPDGRLPDGRLPDGPDVWMSVHTDAPAGQPVRAPSRNPASGRWLPSLRSIGDNVLAVAGAPFQLSRMQQLEVLGAAGLTLGLMSEADGPVHTHVRRDGSSVASTATGPLAAPGRLYDRIGPDPVAFGTAGLLAAGGVLTGNRHWTRASVRLTEAVVYTNLVVGLGKGLVSRTRPASAGGPVQADIGAFSSDHENLSMPSGHTAQAFAVASVLAHEFDRWTVRAPAYTAAVSVGIERVRSGDHWLSDVVIGGALGYLIGRSVSSSPPQPQRVRYRPILSPDRLGIRMQF